jgi:large subunit ribosomal protein L22
MQFRASHQYADMSVRKLRQFADLIRKRDVDVALELLKFLPNRGARLVERVLLSAVGNAEDRGGVDTGELRVIEACIDGGPIMKRIMPRARGTAYPIKRRYSHIRIVVGNDQEEAPE